MITEDYVSFEIAKLLKEKGFNEGCRAHYGTSGSFSYEKYEVEAAGCGMYNAILAPTLQMAMKWLREVHKLHIIIQYGNVGSQKEPQMQYWFEVVDDNGQYCYGNIVDGNTSYEESCESAIKYCLENLI